MKMFKKITAWALLSILLQISGLYILENFIFKHTSEFKSNKIEVQKRIIQKIFQHLSRVMQKILKYQMTVNTYVIRMAKVCIWKTPRRAQAIQLQQKKGHNYVL